MLNIIQRNGWFFYDRRIPTRYADYDPRVRVRVSLDTKCPKIAKKRSAPINNNVERYWENLCLKKEKYSKLKFKELVKTARELGYSYIPAFKIPEFPIEEIVSRLMATNQYLDKENLAKAVIGSTDAPEIKLAEALELYWEYSKPLIVNKNPNQLRKWRNPKIKALKNLIAQIGDITISELTNKKLLKLRDWWLERITQEGIRASSANKDFTHIKSIIETVAVHEELDIDTQKLFRKIHLRDNRVSKREVYSESYLKECILNSDVLNYLDDELRSMLYVSIETGARPTEILNLDGKNDIILDCEIPHINIRPRKNYSLKTTQSERKIPLVGKALQAFKKYPDGFISFKGKPDQFSHHINSFLSKYELKPTSNHTYYSLRHSFQDRLTALEVPDRIQCQLMGHKFNRPTYGKGASLLHLQKVLEKTRLT